MSKNNKLYSLYPRERLEAAQSLDTGTFIQKQTNTAPDGKWPYGMPTSINPLVLLIGASPGGSPNLNQPPIDYTPSAGKPHEGLFYRDTASFFERARKLGILLVKGLDPDFNQEDALSLVGILNLSVTESADASDMSEMRYATWAIKKIEEFRPRFAVLDGMIKELKRSEIRNAFNYRANPINWKRPQVELQFQNTKYRTRGWFRNNTFFVLLPNHLGKPPMTRLGALEAVAADILNLANSQDVILPPSAR